MIKVFVKHDSRLDPLTTSQYASSMNSFKGDACCLLFSDIVLLMGFFLFVRVGGYLKKRFIIPLIFFVIILLY